MELLAEFSTEHKSIKWLEKIRWDKEPICPHCCGIENIGKYKSKKHIYWHTVNHSAKEFVNGMAHTNGIESV